MSHVYTEGFVPLSRPTNARPCVKINDYDYGTHKNDIGQTECNCRNKKKS